MLLYGEGGEIFFELGIELTTCILQHHSVTSIPYGDILVPAYVLLTIHTMKKNKKSTSSVRLHKNLYVRKKKKQIVPKCAETPESGDFIWYEIPFFSTRLHFLVRNYFLNLYIYCRTGIKQYSMDQAKKYGYTIKLSSNKKKKLDVFKDRIKIGSIGNLLYKDFPTYISEKGLDYAKVRRQLYHNRHKKDIEIKGSNGWLASILLW